MNIIISLSIMFIIIDLVTSQTKNSDKYNSLKTRHRKLLLHAPQKNLSVQATQPLCHTLSTI